MSQINPSRVKPKATADPDELLRKSDRTRQAILDSSLEFLWSRPFREMTVAELMSTTDAGRSAYYRYFSDLHELMETLLWELEEKILEAANPWFRGQGEPVAMLCESLAGLVRVCYERGPILRAVSDATATDERLERSWTTFLAKFDDAVSAQIERHQANGFIAEFDARPVAIALNRMGASLLNHAFGRRPRSNPQPILDAITRIWTSTLYDV